MAEIGVFVLFYSWFRCGNFNYFLLENDYILLVQLMLPLYEAW
jgi:hypothetical protein